MCGICGVFGRTDRDVVGRMLATIRHRGPDDEFIVSGDGFTMAAARLSIIDVAGGRQPLTNEDGTVTASQNGEIYNFGLLREQLLQQGHVLQTRSDTEVLPHLWEDEGCRLPERIDGMFAVAVWDEKKQAGLLARDRVGKKPLYYWEHDGAIYYASELKALLAIPGFDRRLNLRALHHYLSYKHVPHPLTIFEDVRILPPAHRLRFETGAPPRVERYWRLSFAPRDEPIGDDLLSTAIIASPAPVIIVPCMNEQMWFNKAVQRNVGLARENGYVVMEPVEGIEVADMQPSYGSMPRLEKIIGCIAESIAAKAEQRDAR